MFFLTGLSIYLALISQYVSKGEVSRCLKFTPKDLSSPFNVSKCFGKERIASIFEG